MKNKTTMYQMYQTCTTSFLRSGTSGGSDNQLVIQNVPDVPLIFINSY